MGQTRYPRSESSTLELKRTIPKNDQIIKTLVGFCNRHGGQLIIGVEDDRSIVGVDENEIEQCLEWLEKGIYEASFPPIIPRVSLLRIGNKSLIEIEVSSGMNKPYYRRSEGMEKGTYVRLGRSAVRATPEMVEELRWKSAGKRYESFAVYNASIQDLDEQAIQNFLWNRKNRGEADLTFAMLESYGLAVAEHGHQYPTNAGILLFGKEPQQFLSEAMIICTHFHGTSGRDVVATVDCTGTLFDQFRTAYDFLLNRLTRAFKIEGLEREEQLEVPKKALRETLLNLVIHRNYHLSSSSKIAIWSDRIEFFSPGGFPGPIDVNDLRAGRSYLRNAGICKVFREAGYIEKLGSGLIVLLDSYAERKILPPQLVDGGDYVKYILPRPSAENDISAVKEGVEMQIIQYIRAGKEVPFQEIMRHVGIPRATLNRILTELLKRGVIERVGKTRAIRYRLPH